MFLEFTFCYFVVDITRNTLGHRYIPHFYNILGRADKLPSILRRPNAVLEIDIKRFVLLISRSLTHKRVGSDEEGMRVELLSENWVLS